MTSDTDTKGSEACKSVEVPGFFRTNSTGQLQNPVGIEDEFVDVELYGVEGVLHDERDEDSRPIFEMPFALSDHC